MKSLEIQAKLRTSLGKKDNKNLRMNKNVPCVLYGGKEDNIHFYTTEEELKKFVYTPSKFIADVIIDKTKQESILKDIQFHPVSDKIIHADFIRIISGELIETVVPINLIGIAKGVKEGGKLQMKTRNIKIKATKENLPDNIEINVENIELGGNVKVKDVLSNNFEILNTKETVIATVNLTKAAKGMKSDDEEETKGGEEETKGGEDSKDKDTKEGKK